MCTSQFASGNKLKNFQVSRPLGRNENTKPLGRNLALGGGNIGTSGGVDTTGTFINPITQRNTGAGTGRSGSVARPTILTGGFGRPGRALF